MSTRGGKGPLDLAPLTARSVVLSTLLGSHPPRLPARSLVRVGALFGIAEGTVRVALSRMAADGDLIQADATYRLPERLLERQRRQDEARAPATRPWHGDWELAVTAREDHPGPGASPPERLRLAELRPGVWMRPANLARTWPARLAGYRLLVTRPVEDAANLAAGLWDLTGWAGRADALGAAMAAVDDPAQRFTLSAAVVRHLRADPCLPGALLPARWPGEELRAAYGGFERELADLLRAPGDPAQPGGVAGAAGATRGAPSGRADSARHSAT